MRLDVLLVSVMSVMTTMNVAAQDYDDIYYDASKDTKIEKPKATSSSSKQVEVYSVADDNNDYQYNAYAASDAAINNYSSGSEIVNGRDVDEYNRRYTDEEVYEAPADDSSLAQNSSAASSQQYSESYATDGSDDYTYTKRIRAFYNPVVIVETPDLYYDAALLTYTVAALTPSFWYPSWGWNYWGPSYHWSWHYSPWSWSWGWNWAYDPWFGPSWYSPWHYCGWGWSHHWHGGGWHAPYPHYGHSYAYNDYGRRPFGNVGTRRPSGIGTRGTSTSSGRPGYATTRRPSSGGVRASNVNRGNSAGSTTSGSQNRPNNHRSSVRAVAEVIPILLNAQADITATISKLAVKIRLKVTAHRRGIRSTAAHRTEAVVSAVVVDSVEAEAAAVEAVSVAEAAVVAVVNVWEMT